MVRSTRSSSTNDSEEKPVKVDDNAVEGDLKVFLMEKNLLNSDKDLEIVNLKNPGTGQLAKYIINDSIVYELVEFKENFRSWFIGERISSNGKIYLTTKVDPLFLVLPYLMKECTTNAVPLDHVLIDNEAPKLDDLRQTLKASQLKLVCDLKKSGDIEAYKFNEEKTLNWLSRKSQKLSKILSLKKIQCGSSVTSANFVKSEKIEDDVDNEDIQRCAFQMISDYIPEEFAEKLRLKLGITLKTVVQSSVESKNKRKSTGVLESDLLKKVKSEEESFIEEPVKKVEKEQKVTAKSKAMAKAASGTKSISSFFTKK